LRQSPADQNAWHVFVERYGPQIQGWCQRWGLQDADAKDVSQMVLLRLASRMRGFDYDPARSFRSWLKTVCRNACSDLAATRARQIGSGGHISEFLESVPAREDLAEQLAGAYDLELYEEAMRRARGRVQPQTWKAFHLTAVEGLSGAETASRLNAKVTVVFKAKSNVQKLIQEELRYLKGDAPDE
jgi:RNA polymerase sigma-70 factor (ECF subfamily)